MYKWQILNQFEQHGIVAVVRKIDPEKVDDVIVALVEGGVKILEITVDSENSYDTIARAKKKYSNDLLIGAGTVLDRETAKTAIDAKADFIFSPIFDEDIIQITNQYGKISIPGVYTPTEILKAYACGADLLKVFPATTLGPKFFKDVAGPMGHIPLMPTGGVDLNNIQDFVHAGAVAVGVGSSLLNKEYIANNQFDALSNLAHQYVTKFKEAKGK